MVCFCAYDDSPPFSIHWNISRHGSGIDDLHITNVSTVTDQSKCYYDIQHQFQQPGNYLLMVLVENGVSQAHMHYNLRIDLPKSGKLCKIVCLKNHSTGAWEPGLSWINSRKLGGFTKN